MRARLRGLALAVLLAAPGAPAVACGFCIEDRVAAVYDQAMVDGALAKKRNVAFFAIEGLKGDPAARRSVIAALEGSGAIRGSARISLESAACSVVFDPARTSAAALAAAADRALASRGLVLSPLRIIDEGGRLKDPLIAAEALDPPRSLPR